MRFLSAQRVATAPDEFGASDAGAGRGRGDVARPGGGTDAAERAVPAAVAGGERLYPFGLSVLRSIRFFRSARRWGGRNVT